MNLQQTYDLLGQILKERPELAECTLLNYTKEAEAFKAFYSQEAKTLRIVNCNYFQAKNEVQVWQSQ